MAAAGLPRDPPAASLLARDETAALNHRLVLYGLAFTAFLLLRVATLATSFEAVSGDEELQRGTIAHELTVGLKAPFWEYRADSYSGGSLVVGLLAAPLFWAFGPRLVVLKLVPLAISLLTLGLLIVLLDRYHSRRAAWVGAFLFVLSAPFPTQLSLLAMGYHTESIVFSVLLVLGWARAIERPEGSGPFWLGLTAGLAFSFTYITALTTLGCLLCSGPLLRRGDALAKLAGGLAAGLAPWAAYNVTHRLDGVRITYMFLTPPEGAFVSIPRFVLRLGWRGATVIALAVPCSYGFPAMLGVPGAAWSYAYFGLTLAPIVWLVLRARARPPVVRPLLASAVVFVVVYPFTRFGVPTGGPAEEFRHFFPVQFVLLTVLAIALAEVPFGKAATVGLIVLGAMGQATLFGRDPTPQLVDYRGYSYFVFGRAWSDRIDPIAPRRDARLARFDEATARLVYWGALSADSRQTSATLLPRIPEVPEEYRPYLAEAVGRAVGVRRTDFEPLLATFDVVPPDVREHFTMGYVEELRVRPDLPLPEAAALRRLPPLVQRWGYFGVGRLLHEECSGWPNAPRCRAVQVALRESAPETAAWVYRGAATGTAASWLSDPAVDLARIGPVPVPPSRRADFAWGLGWSIREAFREDMPRVQDWVARLPPVDRPAALEGVRAYDAFYRLDAEASTQHSR